MSANKNTDARDTYINKDCANIIKFMEITSNSTQAEKTKIAEQEKTSFLKELVENAHLHKPVLNKIKTANK